MKLHIERHDALRVLSLVAGIAARKSTIPILANILLETDEHGLRVLASDMSIEIATRMPARIEEGGSTTVNADNLLALVKSLPEGADMTLDDAEKIENDKIGGRLLITAGRAKFRLPQLPPGIFPRLPAHPGDTFTVAAGDLVEMFDDTAFMGDVSDTRSFVRTVYLALRGDVLRCYGASSGGMGYRDIPAPDDAVSFAGEMIHLNHVTKLRGLLAAQKPAEPITVETFEGQMAFNIGGSLVRVVCVNGAPAPYDTIAAKSKPTHTMTADVDLLTGALRRALVMQTETVKSIRFVCVNGSMTLSAKNMHTGESSDAIDVEASGDFEMILKGPLLLEILGRIKTEQAVFKFEPEATTAGPVIIRETGEPQSLFLVMPMRL